MAKEMTAEEDVLLLPYDEALQQLTKEELWFFEKAAWLRGLGEIATLAPVAEAENGTASGG